MIMKGRPLAKAGYEQELSSIRGFIAMQNKASEGGVAAAAASDKVREKRREGRGREGLEGGRGNKSCLFTDSF